MSVRLPKSTYSDDARPSWIPRQAHEGVPAKPLIRCACGIVLGMGLHHVHADGTVTASFHHWWAEAVGKDWQGCGWHEHVVLDGYATDPMYAGKEFPPRAG